MLLSTDGSVTPLLEASFRAPVAVETRSNVIDRRALQRTAVLRLSGGGRPLLRAQSRLLLDSFPPAARAALLVGDEPIGTVLRDARLETRRELLEVTGDEATADDAADLDIPQGALVFERTYRILCHSREMAVVTERFPASLFDAEAA
jgi:chorismate-pyruvate lyase